MTKHLTLLVTRIIPIFLFIGLALGQEKTVAIFDFSSEGISSADARLLTERIQTELVKLGKVKVVERAKIDDIFKEQKLQLSGCVDECLIEVGKMVGATSIITGSIGKFGIYYTINARMIDATTSEVEKAVSYDSEYIMSDLLVKGAKDIAYQLIGEKFFTGMKITNEDELMTLYYDNGQKEVEGPYRNNLRIGKRTWWYETGEIWKKGEFTDNQVRHGKWTLYRKNGFLYEESIYDNGNLISRKKY